MLDAPLFYLTKILINYIYNHQKVIANEKKSQSNIDFLTFFNII